MSHTIPFPSESALEDFICNCLEKGEGCPVDGAEYELFFRQVNLSSYGIADVLKVNIDNTPHGSVVYITVMELKNVSLKPRDVAQLGRYIKALNRLIEPHEKKYNFSCEIQGQLVGFGYDNDMVFMFDLLHSIEVYDVEVNLRSGFESNCISDQSWYKKGEDSKSINELVKSISKHFPKEDKVNGEN